MSQDLEFSFDNVLDVKLPPTAGIREIVFDDAPTIQRMPISKKDLSKGEATYCVMKAKINDGGKGQYPESEQNYPVYQRFNLDTADGKTDTQLMFKAAGIAVPPNAKFSMLAPQLKGRTARAEFAQSNGQDANGSPQVYFNFRKWIVDASMLTNVPGKTPPVPTVSA